MIEYILVRVDEVDQEKFVFEVNRHIRQGYEPLGGVSVRAGSSRGADLLQAMIKQP